MIDHFWRLRVAWDADDDTIRHAYHRLAREVHPDLAPATASAHERRHRQHAMARLNESFAVLDDPVRRAEHRRALAAHRARRHPRRVVLADPTTTRPTAPAAPPRPAAPRVPTPAPDPADDGMAWPGFVRTWAETPTRRARRSGIGWRARLVVYVAGAVFGLVVSALSDDTTVSDPTVTTVTAPR